MRNKFKLAVIALAGLGALTVSGFGQGARSGGPVL